MILFGFGSDSYYHPDIEDGYKMARYVIYIYSLLYIGIYHWRLSNIFCIGSLYIDRACIY